MKTALILVFASILAYPISEPNAQTKSRRASATKTSAGPLNPQIQRIVREILASNIESTIKRLVSFGTRHTLSETESNTRGVGAARRWIKSEFDRYSRESGGRLQVPVDELP